MGMAAPLQGRPHCFGPALRQKGWRECALQQDVLCGSPPLGPKRSWGSCCPPTCVRGGGAGLPLLCQTHSRAGFPRAAAASSQGDAKKPSRASGCPSWRRTGWGRASHFVSIDPCGSMWETHCEHVGERPPPAFDLLCIAQRPLTSAQPTLASSRTDTHTPKHTEFQDGGCLSPPPPFLPLPLILFGCLLSPSPLGKV